jgi:excinuclease ABC subunit A
VDAGNTVVVIEHNLDVVKTADWIIDLGPEGGAGGGRIVCEGTPEQVAACEASPTGRALRAVLHPSHSPLEGEGRGEGSNADRLPHPSPLSPDPFLRVSGARQHNLKDVSLAIPRGKITVFSGPSGSGKTSLAMDTVYAEGQRRYVESLSSYARQFLGRLQKPAVDHISGLSPAIAIEQKTVGNTPRSTVGTVTEIYDYLRVLFARIGKPHCTECGGPVGSRTVDQIVDAVLTLPEGSRALLLAPLAEPEDRAWDDRLREARKNGFVRARIDGAVTELTDGLSLDRKRRHVVELVADRAVIRPDQRGRLADSIEAALAISGGRLTVAPADAGGFAEMRFNQKHSCQTCGTAFEELTPHHFSFNAPLGWCPACDGLGRQSGANPAVVVPHPERSIREGAIAGWKFAARKPKADARKPKVPAAPAAATIEPSLEEIVGAVCRHVGLSMDEPFDAQPPERRHKLLYGTGEDWIDVRPGLSVQFHGLFPAISRAAKLSWAHRSSLSHVVADVECSACRGGRVRADAAAVRIAGKTIADVCTMPLAEAYGFFRGLKVPARERKVVGEALNELVNRLKFLIDVGLEYLHLHRAAPTLSGGESQRIQLAGRLGSGLTGVLYVLDEPTIGLHPRDTQRLVKALAGLRDLGNTLIMVEHDRDVIAAADHVVDFGPGAGRLGGRVVAEGPPASMASVDGESHTARHLAGRDDIPVPAERRPGDGKFLELIGARHNNLQGVDVRFPLGTLTAVTGVSGSGKSSLIGDILRPALARRLHRANVSPAGHDELRGVQHLDKVIDVDQTPLGSTPTSNPATYTGAFDDIRLLFSRLPESRERGYKADRFSFNKPGGRCEACEGAGRRKIEMHFLADVWVECEGCRGTRYQSDVLEVRHRGKNISDVLNMTVDDAAALFAETPKIARTLQTLADVGLGYLQLGQPADTLSGGESQRVRLAAELARPGTGRTLYLLDEPTTGLHVEDVRKLLAVLHKLVDLGNTVVVIEHNLDVIKNADWILDMGPEAGAGGGRLVAAGTPEQVAAVAESHTGRALAPVLARSPREARKARLEGRDVADGPVGLADLLELLGRLAAMPDPDRMEYEAMRLCRPDAKASDWFLTVLPSVKPAMWLKLRGAFADAQVAGLPAARKLSGDRWEVNVPIHQPADLAAPALKQLLVRCFEGSPKNGAKADRGRRVEADE